MIKQLSDGWGHAFNTERSNGWGDGEHGDGGGNGTSCELSFEDHDPWGNGHGAAHSWQFLKDFFACPDPTDLAAALINAVVRPK